MKKGTIILGSIIGGAILGTAVTLCMTSKKSADMRKMMHEKLLAQLDHLHDHIKGCSCMTGGECDCECGDKMDSVEKMQEVVKEKIDEVKDKVGEKIGEMKGKMSNVTI